MIENGLGMTITNNLITEGFQADIVKIPVDPPQYIRFGIMIPNKEALSPAARKFVQYAKRILTEIAFLSHQANQVCHFILGFLHVVSVYTAGLDYHSSAKRSPFSPTPLLQQRA